MAKMKKATTVSINVNAAVDRWAGLLRHGRPRRARQPCFIPILTSKLYVSFRSRPDKASSHGAQPLSMQREQEACHMYRFWTGRERAGFSLSLKSRSRAQANEESCNGMCGAVLSFVAKPEQQRPETNAA